jgi:hypothetical protein
MVDECRSHVEQVFASLARAAPIDARAEMKLQAALGASLLFTKGAIPAAREASTATLRLACSLGDTEHQLRALWELWVHHTNTGELAAALAVAQRFYTLAQEHADPATLSIADRMMGMSYHYLGDQTNAWQHIERMLSADVDPNRRFPLNRFWFDQRSGRVALARIFGSGVSPTRRCTVQSAVATRRLADAATLCYALCHGGCLVALWWEIWPRRNVTRKCCSIIRAHGFAVWNDFASRLKGVIVKTGDLDGGRHCCAPAFTRSPELQPLVPDHP